MGLATPLSHATAHPSYRCVGSSPARPRGTARAPARRRAQPTATIVHKRTRPRVRETLPHGCHCASCPCARARPPPAPWPSQRQLTRASPWLRRERRLCRRRCRLGRRYCRLGRLLLRCGRLLLLCRCHSRSLRLSLPARLRCRLRCRLLALLLALLLSRLCRLLVALLLARLAEGGAHAICWSMKDACHAGP